jgi:hypothetical protein
MALVPQVLTAFRSCADPGSGAGCGRLSSGAEAPADALASSAQRALHKSASDLRAFVVPRPEQQPQRPA